MTPEEIEELKQRDAVNRPLIEAYHKEIEEGTKRIEENKKMFYEGFEAINKLSEANQRESQQFHTDYKKEFLAALAKRPNAKTKLSYVLSEITDLTLRMGEAKSAYETFLESKLKNVLHDIVLPYKTELLERARLENEIGTLGEMPIVQEEVEVMPPVHDVGPIKPLDDMNNYRASVFISDIMIPLDSKTKGSPEIEIPVRLQEKPLTTKTGKPLNNAEHIAAGRKFAWSDSRIPNLLGEFLLEKECILDYQLKTVQDFFRTTKSDIKIVFAGQANQLTTMFYDLKSQKYLAISTKYLGEITEAVFVKKENTMKALIAQKSLVADLKLGSVDRRTKVGSPHYLDVLRFLEEKLKDPEA